MRQTKCLKTGPGANQPLIQLPPDALQRLSAARPVGSSPTVSFVVSSSGSSDSLRVGQ